LHQQCINMHTKTNRQIAIKEILSSHQISKQEELLTILTKKGFELTQATLSRDLKELNIGTKYDKNFGHIYFIPNQSFTPIINEVSELKGVISLEISGNIAVLKTQAGFANSVAVIIDNKQIDSIIGTLAGNDTIMIIIKEKVKKKEFIDSLNKTFTNIIKILKP